MNWRDKRGCRVRGLDSRAASMIRIEALWPGMISQAMLLQASIDVRAMDPAHMVGLADAIFARMHPGIPS
ncbi:hypothetical protein [Paucibacter sp. DJ2R-2]|uniref:hypothetical protein n=1 Tax=Paucibacter sp. DJ2R-2 TaxID=2893558 RepID=UPI0021E3AE2B|nr:hypothetical protein [Paucibacter sp. DJ2R-2]MCV2436903.1 hypothetical protein [Paucibacter sp. DJ2R-2]